MEKLKSHSILLEDLIPEIDNLAKKRDVLFKLLKNAPKFKPKKEIHSFIKKTWKGNKLSTEQLWNIFCGKNAHEKLGILIKKFRLYEMQLYKISTELKWIKIGIDREIDKLGFFGRGEELFLYSYLIYRDLCVPITNTKLDPEITIELLTKDMPCFFKEIMADEIEFDELLHDAKWCYQDELNKIKESIKLIKAIENRTRALADLAKALRQKPGADFKKYKKRIKNKRNRWYLNNDFMLYRY